MALPTLRCSIIAQLTADLMFDYLNSCQSMDTIRLSSCANYNNRAQKAGIYSMRNCLLQGKILSVAMLSLNCCSQSYYRELLYWHSLLAEKSARLALRCQLLAIAKIHSEARS